MITTQEIKKHKKKILVMIQGKSYNLTATQIRLYKTLKDNGSLYRKELVSKSGIARSTIFDNLKRLMNKNLVEKIRKYNGMRGRPKEYWCISNNGHEMLY